QTQLVGPAEAIDDGGAHVTVFAVKGVLLGPRNLAPQHSAAFQISVVLQRAEAHAARTLTKVTRRPSSSSELRLRHLAGMRPRVSDGWIPGVLSLTMQAYGSSSMRRSARRAQRKTAMTIGFEACSRATRTTALAMRIPALHAARTVARP